MSTQCSQTKYAFQPLGSRRVEADFAGGDITSDAGALLLREMDGRLGLTAALAACFVDHRDPELIEHPVGDLVRQRVYGLALGYEDLNDHESLRTDPLLAAAVGKEDPQGHERRCERDRGRALAGKSTLQRLEQVNDAGPDDRYHKIGLDRPALEALFVSLFLDAHSTPPEEAVLDFDATDDRVHGTQEGRFYHGYYDSYCFLPLYVFCGDHLLWAGLRPANADASAGAEDVLTFLVQRLRARWPHTRIVVRADSGFARERLMARCEALGVGYLLGLAGNTRLEAALADVLMAAQCTHLLTGQPARRFTTFLYRTRDSWSRARRVVGKAEWLSDGANPRYVVTNLPEAYATPQALYEVHYCARGDMENRIKEQQMDLFADRTSCSAFAANQVRLWLASAAYVLMAALRRTALAGTRAARATCGTIRRTLLKIGARVRVSARRVYVALASACPAQDLFAHAWRHLQTPPLRT